MIAGRAAGEASSSCCPSVLISLLRIGLEQPGPDIARSAGRLDPPSLWPLVPPAVLPPGMLPGGLAPFPLGLLVVLPGADGLPGPLGLFGGWPAEPPFGSEPEPELSVG